MTNGTPKIIKIGEEFYVEYFAQGLKFRKGAGRHVDDAKKLLKEISESQGDIHSIYTVHDENIDRFFEKFLAHARTIHHDISLKRYCDLIEGFLKFLEPHLSKTRKLKEITPKLLQEYQCHLQTVFKQKDRANWVHLNFVLLEDVLDYAIKQGDLNDNPIRHIQYKIDSSIAPVRVLTEDELNLLNKQAGEDLGVMITLMVTTGVRVEEICALTCGDVDFKNNTINIKSFQGRINQDELRCVPLESRALAVLKDLIQKKEDLDKLIDDWQEDQFKSQVDVLMKNCKIKEATFNALRHTFAFHCLKRGVSLIQLYKLMGMHDILQVMIYASFVVHPLEGSSP